MECVNSTISVVIVDDHAPYRESIVAVLGAMPDIAVIGTGGSADDAVRLAIEHAPDLLLLDLDMPGGGVEAAQRLAIACPCTTVFMLTFSDSPHHRAAAHNAGVRKYLLKGISGRELADEIRSVKHRSLC